MQVNIKTVNRFAFVMWSFLSNVFLAFGAWLFLDLFFTAEYFPSSEYNLGTGPKLWEVLWDVSSALIVIPAPWILIGLLFRRFAFWSKSNRLPGKSTRFSIGQ